MAQGLTIFLHAGGQSPQMFGDQVTALPPDRQVAAPWLYGLRPGRDDQFGVQRAADDVARTADLHGVDRVDLCGVELGARVALEFAIRHNDRVQTLVLASLLPHQPWLLRSVTGLAARLVPASAYRNQRVDKAKVLAALREGGRLGVPALTTRIEQRTLLLCGSRDPGGQQAARRVEPKLPNAVLQVIDNAGSLINLDQPKAFNDALAAFWG